MWLSLAGFRVFKLHINLTDMIKADTNVTKNTNYLAFMPKLIYLVPFEYALKSSVWLF